MSKLDYKLLQALSYVIKEQSFERAAGVLCLSQSAVSQRIKQLEQQFAQPVLIRSQPIQTTDLGKQLLKHYYQVVQLEADVLPSAMPHSPQTPLTLNIATNADTLATWLIPAIAPVIKSHLVEINLLIEGEARTINRLKDGQAFGAISVQSTPIKGCQLTRLGCVDYLLVASLEFSRHYFPNGISTDSLRKAPGIAFDHKDNMHTRYIQQHFNLMQGEYPLHAVRSSDAFVTMAKHGAAYCLVPKTQIKPELATGELVHICKDHIITETLYWHHWILLKGVYKDVSDAIIAHAQSVLD
ncbi:LysR family transcriptional regulator ArgP [Shewanella frigidimarina]|uniref:Chromosome replication initiation inhibitor protein n=1 Tax=Shewanella frigidimarina TaxID=56812 RepID=A0A106C129_SHEFR|nr:LysR family transcriptional regulator ArgP [Shewanella frigidimarina]KVX02312.1 chromosome replication initiation inhibitor protein [Shewanella frigidimarina]